MGKTSLFLLVFFGFWTVIIGLFDVFIGLGMYHQIQAESFPHVSGVITHSTLSRDSSDDGVTYGVDVEYRYEIDGHTYHSNTYRFDATSTSDYRHQRGIVDSLPVGKKVDVFYDPADPGRATLETGIGGSNLFMAMFMLPFNMVMLGGWMLGVFILGSKRNAQTGGVAVEQTFHGARARFRRFGALPTAMATLGAAGFLGIFIIGFTLGLSPPMTVMIRVWWGLALLGLIALVGKFIFNRVSPLNLTIDQSRGELTLPGGDATPIPFDRITKADVRHSGSQQSGIYCYKPTIRYTDQAGKPRSAKLPALRDRDMAERFNDWLRQRVGLDDRTS